MLLIHHSISLTSKIQEREVPEGLRGYMMHHTITPVTGAELNLFSIYTPMDNPSAVTSAHEYIRKHMAAITILAGDMNPASNAHNEAQLNATVRKGGLHSLSQLGHTFRSPATGATSKLDFIYSTCSPDAHPTKDIPTDNIYHSDHVPVVVEHLIARVGFGPTTFSDPTYRPTTVKVLEAPNKEQLQSLQTDVITRHWETMHTIEDTISTLHEVGIAIAVDTIQATLLDIQNNILPKYAKVSSSSQTSFRHFPRQMSRRRKRIVRTIQLLQMVPHSDRHQAAVHMWDQIHPAVRDTISPILTIQELLTHLHTELDEIHKKHVTHKMQAATARAHMTYKRKPKIIHEELKNPGLLESRLSVLLTVYSSGQVTA
jgi:hypothetical protein